MHATVVVVGHTSWGGTEACWKATQRAGFNPEGPIATIESLPAEAPLNRWLEPLTKFVASLVGPGLNPSLVEKENVRLQVKNLSATEVIAKAWATGSRVQVHGWIHDVATGRLSDLSVSAGPK